MVVVENFIEYINTTYPLIGIAVVMVMNYVAIAMIAVMPDLTGVAIIGAVVVDNDFFAPVAVMAGTVVVPVVVPAIIAFAIIPVVLPAIIRQCQGCKTHKKKCQSKAEVFTGRSSGFHFITFF
jgi:hypothetical protein